MKNQTKLSVEQNMPYEAPQLQVTEVKVESGFALSNPLNAAPGWTPKPF